MSNDVAESINQLIAGYFGHVGLRQLHTKVLSDHDPFAYIEQRSNEPLRHHNILGHCIIMQLQEVNLSISKSRYC